MGKWAEVVRKDASKRIQSRDLVENFLTICASSKLSSSRKIRLFEQILEKTLHHARMDSVYQVSISAILNQNGEREISGSSAAISCPYQVRSKRKR
jgi:hypothetical protein